MDSLKDHGVVRKAEERDLSTMAKINASIFLGDRDSVQTAEEWMRCLFKAYPLYQYFVIEVDGTVVGYIGWQIHGGFLRAEPVVELEQLGVSREYQGQKLGPRLTDESLKEVIEWLKAKDTRIESHITVVVWGYALNFNAMKVYAERFTDGVTGMRIQYGNRAENMFRVRIPLVRPVRSEE